MLSDGSIDKDVRPMEGYGNFISGDGYAIEGWNL